MQKLTTIRNILITCTLLFSAVPAVDGGTTENYFTKLDKAPLNKHVKQFVKVYILENRNNLNSIKKRSSSPFVMIDSVMRNYGLPVQLKYLAVVESELKTKAVSRVGAVGPWQLMPSTARIMGLKVTKHHDDRKNYYKSTVAAARHLKDLHKEFGDWFLVFAAYNGGEGPVYSAIKKSGSKNYWTLQRYLPEETREYVKKYIATCYYFEGSYSPALLSNSKGISYSNSSKSLGDIQAVKITARDMPQVKDESSEEKFNRILKESEESLQKSNNTLDKSK